MEEPLRRRHHHHSVQVNDQPMDSPPLIKRKRRRKRTDDPPFWILVLQVGTTIFVISFVCWGLYRQIFPGRTSITNRSGTYGLDDDYNDDQQQLEGELTNTDKVPTRAPTPMTAPPLPRWDLSDQTRWDAYGLLDQYHNSHHQEGRADKYVEFWNHSQLLCNDFANRYGGINAARAILERSLITFARNKNSTSVPSDLQATACRLRKSVKSVFKVAFAGSSVGSNTFHQSFPFVLQTKLEPLLDTLMIDLQLRHAAIEDTASFPFAWCFQHHLGLEVDVISWDYSLQDPGGIPQGLEAYLRKTQRLMSKPKLLVRDSPLALDRRSLLQKYVNSEVLLDPVVFTSEVAIKPFLPMEERYRPIGFQQWRQSSSVRRASLRENELLGWILVMHFLAAAELLVLQEYGIIKEDGCHKRFSPMPQRALTTNETSSLLFGTTRKIHCRTSFEPILSGDLADIITGGLVDFETESDLLLPKGPMYYNKGWVLDLTEEERLAKRKRLGGFLDSKKAYFGIYASGPLSFHLPLSNQTQSQGNVADRITSIVVCQVSDKDRNENACRPDTQMDFIIGGFNVTNATMLAAAGTVFLGQEICTELFIPPAAQLSLWNSQLGVNVTIRVTDQHIRKKELACTISHIVWEEKEPKSA
jgi:hypothetical protein